MSRRPWSEIPPTPKRTAFWVFMVIASVAAAGMLWSSITREPDSSYVSTYTPPPPSPDLLIVGDSYTAGAKAQPETRGFAYLVGDALGLATRVEGLSGTGWTWGGGTDGTAGRDFITRLSELGSDSALQPKVVVIQGGQNDYRSSAPEMQAAVTASINVARTQWPAAQIVVFGPTAPLPLANNLGPRAGWICQAATNSGVPCIDPIAEKWITAENSAKFDSGDGSHLNTEGHQFIANRFLDDYAALVRTGT